MKIKILFILFVFLSQVYSQVDSTEVEPNIWRSYNPGEMPEIIGGLISLLREIKYPEQAIEQKLEGRVIIKILVDTNGVGSEHTIIKSPNLIFNEEALRVAKLAKFKSAIINGKKVNHPIIVPIIFRLKSNNN